MRLQPLGMRCGAPAAGLRRHFAAKRRPLLAFARPGWFRGGPAGAGSSCARMEPAPERPRGVVAADLEGAGEKWPRGFHADSGIRAAAVHAYASVHTGARRGSECNLQLDGTAAARPI